MRRSLETQTYYHFYYLANARQIRARNSSGGASNFAYLGRLQHLAKVDVEGSNPFSRSTFSS